MTELVNLSPIKEEKEEINLRKREIHPLFPTFVFSSVVDNKKFLSETAKNIMALTKKEGAGDRAGNLGWYSKHDMHLLPEFEDLHDLILKEMVMVFDYYMIQYESVYITSMWANVGYRPEYCHQNHIHPNSMFSGVLHVNIPPNGQGTAFSDPRPAARIFEPNHENLGPSNSGVIVPKHNDGQLFIFPSYLPHGVHSSHKSYGKGNQRITISFNAMMTGEITTQTAPLTLK